MLKFDVIGPGRNGAWLAGYYSGANFVPLADCNTAGQAEEARDRFEREALARAREVERQRKLRGN